MSDDIIRPDFQAKHTLRIKAGDHVCRHRHVLIAEYQRTVECGDCGAMLSAFEVLLGYAKRERAMGWSRAEEERIRGQIAELKNEERRVKQRLARAKKGSGR